MNFYNPIIRTADIIVINGKDSVSKSITNYNSNKKKFYSECVSGLLYPLGEQPAYYNFYDILERKAESFFEELSGEWVAILKSNSGDEYKVIADHFGLQSVFYRYDINDIKTPKLIVSTNYNSLIEYSKDNSLPCSFNAEQFYLAMAGSNVLMRSAFSTSSFCNEINLLGADQYLYFDAHRRSFRVEKKSFLYDPYNRTYNELIGSGIEKAKQKILSLSQYFDDKRLFLSGGRDSRIVLGLLKSIGLNNNFSVSMGNPRNLSGKAREVVQKDLYVASYLADQYNMNYSEVKDHLRVNLDFKDALSMFLSHSSQLSWTGIPNNRVTFPSTEYLSLRGGGGELFGATNNSIQTIQALQKIDPNILETSFENQVEALFNLYVNINIIPNKHLDNCRNLFYSSFAFDKNYSLEQNIDWHYYYYRNRVHFGHYISSFSKNETTYHPLMQKEFLYAASFHSLESRRDAVICHDILNLLDPELSRVTFDNGYSKFVDKASRTGPTVEQLEKDYNYNKYYEVQRKNSLLINRPIDINNYSIEKEQAFSKYRTYILAINTLFELYFEKVFDIIQLKGAIDNMHAGKASPTGMYLRFLEYKNIYEDYRVSSNKVEVNKKFTKKYLDKRNISKPIELLSVDKKYYKYLSYSVEEDNGLTFKVLLSDEFLKAFEKVEYAFYLYEDGKIIDKFFYTSNNIYRYPSFDKGSRYKIFFFLKLFINNERPTIVVLRSDFLDKNL